MIRLEYACLICLWFTLLAQAADDRLGCLFSDEVCDDDETCFDDTIFGQCVSQELPEEIIRVPNEKLTDADRALVLAVLESLDANGFEWRDPYTQCTLRNILRTIQFNGVFDERDCDILAEAAPSGTVVNDEFIDEQDSNDSDDVPKKEATADDDFYVDDGIPPIEDGSEGEPDDLLIDSTDPDFTARLQGLNEDPDDSDETLASSYDGNMDLQQYLALQQRLQEEDDGDVVEDEVIWPGSEPQFDALEITQDVRKLRKRIPYEPKPDYEDPSYVLYEDYDLEPVIGNSISKAVGGGLGSRIFNRNERLDVKKPGPFYKNSANNFFLDKLLESDYASEDYADQNDTKNLGQVEYEMPLLAPSKDKRELELETDNFETLGDNNQFVHIGLKNKLNTYKQGTNFVKLLEREFGLPRGAITNHKIESNHVQFHVEPNPRGINAAQMAKRIDTDGTLHSTINDQIGVQIDRAAAGHEDDTSFVKFPPAGFNLNLLILVVVAASTAAALLVVGTVLLLVKRRNRILRKQGLLRDDGEDGAVAPEEYKQLCRDWSRSSKKVDNKVQNSATKQIQNQESKDSNRSSTSSWPEEPSANMDISTGHMVLAYMEDHLKNKQRLEQEWVSLCGYEAEPCATTIAFKAENKKKNRYPDKLPYDHNRVILNAMVNANNSDYINASTITDHDPRNPSYIVTQGPLSSTVADFWQMIWEQGCVVIVMLSKLQDNGHQLCQRYWPEEGSEQYHIFEVHLVSEHVWCDDYLVRSVDRKSVV